MNWRDYIGKMASILIVGKGDKTENYIGTIDDVTNDAFMILNPNNPSFNVERIIFKVELIKSVWIYTEYLPP